MSAHLSPLYRSTPCGCTPQRGRAGKPPSQGRSDPTNQEAEKRYIRPKPTPSPFSPSIGSTGLEETFKSNHGPGKAEEPCSAQLHAPTAWQSLESWTSSSPLKHTVSITTTRQRCRRSLRKHSSMPASGKAALIHQDGKHCQALCQHPQQPAQRLRLPRDLQHPQCSTSVPDISARTPTMLINTACLISAFV